MSELHDLTGQKFEHLTVIKRAQENTKHGRAQWICKCDCGKEIVTSGNCLLRGHTKSCGCTRKYNTNLYKHGLSKTRLHRIWRAMKDRCYNSENSHYYLYGGCGITICDEWLNDFVSFYNWSINNGYSENLSIDRIDSDKNYCPENCRWTTDIVQANNKRTNKLFTLNGKTQSLADWCRETGVKYGDAQNRLNYGYSFEEAISPKFHYEGRFKNEENKRIHIICRERNVPYKLVIQRINAGWDLERAISEPSCRAKR